MALHTHTEILSPFYWEIRDALDGEHKLHRALATVDRRILIIAKHLLAAPDAEVHLVVMAKAVNTLWYGGEYSVTREDFGRVLASATVKALVKAAAVNAALPPGFQFYIASHAFRDPCDLPPGYWPCLDANAESIGRKFVVGANVRGLSKILARELG